MLENITTYILTTLHLQKLMNMLLHWVGGRDNDTTTTNIYRWDSLTWKERLANSVHDF